MSKIYFDSVAIIDGDRRVPYATLNPNGGDTDGVTGDWEGLCWKPRNYLDMTRADLISILGGRGSVGWMGRTKADQISELERLDRFVAKVGLKAAIQSTRYKKMNLPELYTEARSRGYPETVKCRSSLEKWLLKKDKTALRLKKERVILNAVKELRSGNIGHAEFEELCASAEEMM